MKSYEQYLWDSVVPGKVIGEFLDSSRPNWVQFDPELGYTLGNSVQHNGVDGCWTLSTTQANGWRTSFMYANRPCRINTYGDSFTECLQVSDCETWQEYQAGHLGDPENRRFLPGQREGTDDHPAVPGSYQSAAPG